MNRRMDRRTFIKGSLGAATALAGGAALAACTPKNAGDSGGTETDGTAASGGGGSYSFENPPEPVTASSEADYDVVVIGAGTAGLAAACAAAEEGAQVVCLEKLSTSGGAGQQYGFFNTKAQLDGGAPERDPEQFYRDLYNESVGATNPKLLRRYVDFGPKIGDWMNDIAEANGAAIKLSIQSGHSLLEYVDPADTAIMAASQTYPMLTAYLTAKGSELLYDTAAEQLVKDDSGKVTAVIAKGENGTYTQYNANRGVIIATGGYNENRGMVEKYMPWVDYDVLLDYTTIPQGNTGDGLAMALWAGAQIGVTPHCPMIHFNTTGRPTGGKLFVNAVGIRFIDEGTSNEKLAQTIMQQPGHTGFSIWDSVAESQAAPAFELPGAQNKERFECATLDEVAEKIGCDPATLKATVERWNELIASGRDSDFYSDWSGNLKDIMGAPLLPFAIEAASFYVEEGPGCMLAMMGGPLINEYLQCQDEDYRPIEGLYAIGNSSSGFYGPNYPMTVQDGTARAYCVISGYLAAKHALGITV